ncbi:MAG: hypothetical protein ACD_79C01370G0002 [uncultured bacterium]|nr:MAG: hypothetical protein ACD_79C01370G0002 [uncultured bacterium]
MTLLSLRTKFCIIISFLFSSVFIFPLYSQDLSLTSNVLTIDRILILSAQNGPNSKDSYWDMQLKRLSLDSTKSLYLPNVTAHNNYNISYSEGSGDFFDKFDSRLSMTWNIFNIKNNYYQNLLAKEEIALMEENNKIVMKKSQIEAISLYFKYLILIEKLNLSDLEIQYNKKISDDALESYKSGYKSRNDFDAAKKVFAESESSYDKLNFLCKDYKTRLLDYLALENNDIIILKPTHEISPPKVPELEALIDHMLDNAVQIKTAQKQVDMADAAVKAAKYSRWTQFNPSFYFSNSVILNDFDWERDRDKFYYGVGLGWRIPLLSGGEYKRSGERAKINYEKALLARKNIPVELKESLKILLDDINEKKNQIQNFQSDMNSLKNYFLLIEDRFNNGYISKTEFEKEKISMNTKKIELELLKYEYIILRAELDALFGSEPTWLLQEKEACLS